MFTGLRTLLHFMTFNNNEIIVKLESLIWRKAKIKLVFRFL